jgi:hypothetical protein
MSSGRYPGVIRLGVGSVRCALKRASSHASTGDDELLNLVRYFVSQMRQMAPDHDSLVC